MHFNNIVGFNYIRTEYLSFKEKDFKNSKTINEYLLNSNRFYFLITIKLVRNPRHKINNDSTFIY